MQSGETGSGRMAQVEGEDVAHEVGHQFSLAHSDGVYQEQLYLMAGEDELGEAQRDFDVFTPTSLDKIRDIDHPIED